MMIQVLMLYVNSITNVKSLPQVANHFSRGPWEGTWRTPAEEIETVQSTNTIGTNASTAD